MRSKIAPLPADSREYLPETSTRSTRAGARQNDLPFCVHKAHHSDSGNGSPCSFPTASVACLCPMLEPSPHEGIITLGCSPFTTSACFFMAVPSQALQALNSSEALSAPA